MAPNDRSERSNQPATVDCPAHSTTWPNRCVACGHVYLNEQDWAEHVKLSRIDYRREKPNQQQEQ